MQEKYASILGGREPLIVHNGLGRGSHVRVGGASEKASGRVTIRED
jgi:hypothetical protein